MPKHEDNHALGMYVTIHPLEFPELHAHLSGITNKQIRSREFKKIASESLRGISTNTVVTLKQAVIGDVKTAICYSNRQRGHRESEDRWQRRLSTDHTKSSRCRILIRITMYSIFKYMLGVVSGVGIACAFLITPLFLILFALGLVGYALSIENERAKKNPPT